ncbi:endonuclease/exonuclease/phosphatase family protein [soil metagenome]
MAFRLFTVLALAMLAMMLLGCSGESPMTFVRDSIARAPDAHESSARADSRDLRVMSFNLRCPTFIDGWNYWPFRKELLVQTIRGFEPDVLGTQECVSSQADYLQEQLPDYEFVGAGRDDGKRGGEMCGVFFRRSRFEKLDSGHFWLSQSPEKPGSRSWGAFWSRMVTWTKLRQRDSGQTFCLFNTHFEVFSGKARVESAGLLRSKMRSIAGERPAIVTGDFNDVPESETYRALTIGGNSTTDPKLTDTFRAAHPQLTSEECTMHSFSGKQRGPRIDWILTSSSVQTIAATINRNKAGLRYPSDHFPVEAILRLPASNTPTKLAASR